VAGDLTLYRPRRLWQFGSKLGGKTVLVTLAKTSDLFGESNTSTPVGDSFSGMQQLFLKQLRWRTPGVQLAVLDFYGKFSGIRRGILGS